MMKSTEKMPIGKTSAQGGFSFIEVMLTTSILVVLAGISIPIYNNFAVRTDLGVARDSFVSAVHNASLRAANNIQDSEWGVYAEAGQIVVFKGSSYSSRDENEDDVLTISNAIKVSGDGEYIFAQLTGEPELSGSTVFSTPSGQSITIEVNEKGTPLPQ